MRKITWFLTCALCAHSLCIAQTTPQQSTAAAPKAVADAAVDPDPPAPPPEIKTDPRVSVKPAPPTPIAEKKAELGDDNTWNPDWDKLVEQSLPAELLSNKRERAVKSLCPRFKSMSDVDKRAFWAYFFQALAGAEAGLKPTANVRHTEPEVAVLDTVTHRTVRQEGLLQLTYMDGPRYSCAFDWSADKELPEHDPAKTILQPKNNLLCGLRIVDNQLLVQRKPLLSKSSYWVTLRPGTLSFNVFLKQMANEPAACGAIHVRHHRTVADAPPSEAVNDPPAAGKSIAAAHPAQAATAVGAH
jgi:hypothetical protein